MAKTSIPGTLVDDVLTSDIAGAFRVTGQRLQCICPCGCGHFMNLPIHPVDQEKTQTPSWSWNGSLDSRRYSRVSGTSVRAIFMGI